jgi:hypothetical protein
MKFLSQTLVTLKHLTVIDLSGNAITEKGIEYFCSTLCKSNAPSEIKSLKLNFNPIKSHSLQNVSELCRKKCITSLYLSSCELAIAANEMEVLANMREVDISYNQFTLNGFKDIIGKILPATVEKLNLERCTSEANVGELIVEFITLNSYNVLQEINLSALKLNENEILDILRCLQRCENLKYVNLSNQSELTILTLKYIFYNMKNKYLKVDLIGCQNLYSSSLQHLSLYQNIDNDLERDTLYPSQIRLSVSSALTELERNDFIANMKEAWAKLTRDHGNINLQKNILYLMSHEIDTLVLSF